MKKNKSTKMGIILAIIFLGIGFAAVTTTLVINGVIRIVPDAENFDKNVKFASANVDADASTAGSTATIAADGKSITFTTHDLKSIGEEAILTYTIRNESQYKAKIGALTCTLVDEDTADAFVPADYVTVTPANALSTAATVLDKNTTSANDTVTVKMIKSYVGDAKSITFNCTMNVDAVEAN